MHMSLMGWVVMGGLGVWAVSMTFLHLGYRRKVGSLMDSLKKDSAGDTGKGNLDGLREKIVERAAMLERLEKELAERNTGCRNLEKELAMQGEQGECMVRDARETGRRVMMNASDTLEKGVGSTRSVIDRLDGIINGAGQGAVDQRTMVQDAATAMEEINASIAQMSENAGQASHAASQAKQESGDGAALVGRTRDRIDEVSVETGRLEAILSRLGQRTEEIGEVINLISDIADQTNLLALNAAIEAARAGESGRGFAVVADEVRKLAEKTMAATREVNDKISGIQEGVSETVAGTGRTATLVADARQLAEDSNRVLEDLAELSSSSHLQVESIAAAITQQAAASEEITRTMLRVDDVSTKTAQDMEMAADEMKQLVGQADAMSELLGVFSLLGKGNLQEAMHEIIVAPVVADGSREQREDYLRKIVADNTCMELLYLTDMQGVQCIANILGTGQGTDLDARAYGKNWSDRPWFTAATRAKGLVVSDVYESVATGNPCVTVSSVVMSGSHQVGVVAVDVALG